MPKHFITLWLCLAIFITQIGYAQTQNLSRNRAELNTVNAQSLSGQTNPEKEKLEKEAKEFTFGAQLGGFSPNYLMFITHYLAGSTMPVVCRNSAVTTLSGPAGILLPNLWIDNIVFSLGSIVYLYFELLVYDHLQKKYAELKTSLNICTTTGSGSGSGIQSSCNNTSDNNNEIHIRALEAEYQAMDYELELLDQKAEATRATKAAWLLSAVLSLATYVTIGNYPDICLGMYPTTLPLLGQGLKDAFLNYKQQEQNASSAVQSSILPEISAPKIERISKQELLQVFDNAKDFESLAMSLTELQLSKAGITHSLSLEAFFQIHNELKHETSFNISDGDFKALKHWFTLSLKGKMLGNMTHLLSGATPISTALASTTEEEFDETMAANKDLTEAKSLGDFFNVFKDVSSMFNTTTNVVNLTKDSTFAEDFKKLSVNPIGQSEEIMRRTISEQFFKQFADYLGFRNGGENAFLIYLTVFGDLVVLKSRSLLANPLVPSLFPVVPEGTFLFKIVSSVVGAHFANAYRQEIIEAKLKIIELKKKISSVLQSYQDHGSGSGASATGGPSAHGGQTAITNTTNNEQGVNCLNQSAPLGPDSIGACPANNNTKGNPLTPMEFGNENNQTIGNIGGVVTGAADALRGAVNRLSMGDVRGSRGNLNGIANSGAQMAAHLKSGLESFDKLHPQKKVKDEIAKVERDIASRIQMAMTAAKFKGGTLQQLASTPFNFTTLSAINADNKKTTASDNSSLDHAKKAMPSETSSLPGFTKIDWNRKRPSGEIGKSSAGELKEPLKEYEYATEDINKESNQNIFEVITLRYFKSAYPIFFKRKD